MARTFLNSSFGVASLAYYRQFVKNYGSISAFFVWSIQSKEAFTTLKQARMSPPLLALPNFDDTFGIETDASDHGLGAVLSHNGHLSAFAGKALSSHKNILVLYTSVNLWPLF